MPGVALAFVILQQEKGLVAACGQVRLREVSDVYWQGRTLKNPCTTGYMVATRITKRKNPLPFR